MIKLLFPLLFTLNAFGSMTIKSALQKMQPQEKKNCCDQITHQSVMDASPSQVELQVECEFSCQNGTKKNISTPLQFSTDAEKLGSGDGYQPKFKVYEFFLTRMLQKSKLACLQAATLECHKLSLVKNANAVSLKSSKWKKDFIIPEFCPANSKEDEPYAANEIFSLPYDVKDNSIKASFPPREFSDLLPTYAKINYANVVSGYPEDLTKVQCKKWIEGTVCYGDCMPSDENRAVLYSQKQGNIGNLPQNVCADELLKVLKDQKISNGVKKLFCEDFFFSSIYNKRSQGITCSAYRGRTNCDSLFSL